VIKKLGKITISSIDYSLMHDDSLDGGCATREPPVITVNTSFGSSVYNLSVLLHEIGEVIFVEDDKRYQAVRIGEGTLKYLFNFDHEYYTEFMIKFAAALLSNDFVTIKLNKKKLTNKKKIKTNKKGETAS